MKQPIRVAFAVLLATSPCLAQTSPTDPAPASSLVPAEEGAPRPLPAERPAPSRSNGRYFFSVAGGYGYQSLYSTRIGGGDVVATFGADMGKLSLAVIADFERGWTVDGLRSTIFGMGPMVELHLGRLRCGGGYRMGIFDVNRATRSGSLFNFDAGVFALTSVDLITFEKEQHGAIFLVATGSVRTVGTALWGASGGIGVRF